MKLIFALDLRYYLDRVEITVREKYTFLLLTAADAD
jgi:hypothetical protein